MGNSAHDKMAIEESVLDKILQHIIVISGGECHITNDTLISCKDEKSASILAGLLMLFEDIELYKKDFAEKLETEYQFKLLQKQNEELIQFNYIASHDLQEPLRTIMGFSDLLQKNTEKLDQENQMYLKFILDSSKRMSNLINDLLNYSKAAGDYGLVAVDCAQIVEDVLADLRHTITTSNATVTVDPLPIVKGNKTGLRQVFQNLIGNGLKFRKPDSAIQIHVSVLDTSQEYTFRIEDTGIGMEEQHLKRIFKVFQRLHNKNDYEGTGIGLSLCKKIIGIHNGRIWVESESGVGSCFYFTIPKNNLP